MNWYVYGEAVIDRYLNLRTVQEVSVFCEGVPPSASTVRAVVGLLPSQSIQFTDTPPRLVCSFDDIVITDDGGLGTRLGLAAPDSLPELTLVAYDLSAADIIRLHSVYTHFDAVVIDSTLVARLVADISHLRHISNQFPEVAGLFDASATLYRWAGSSPKRNP